VNLRQKPLVIALSLVLAVPTGLSARPAGSALQARDAASPSVDEIAAATSQKLLVLQSGIFDPTREQIQSRTLSLPQISGSRYAVVQFNEGQRLSATRLRALGAEVLEYIPHNAYLVRLDDPSAGNLRSHTAVRFVGSWQPAWKIAPDLHNVSSETETLIVDVFGFRGEIQQSFSDQLERSITHGVLAGGDKIGDLPHAWFRVQRSELAAFLRETAVVDQVSWMARFQMPVLHNRDSVGPVQTNQASDTGGPTAAQAAIWAKGLTGSNQIVAVADSGMDRNQEFFIRLNKGAGVVEAVTNAQNTNPPALGTVFPNNKVYGYFVMPGASPYDDNQDCGSGGTSFHGTHTSGSVAGDSGTTSTPTAGNWNTGDGMAPNAQLLFQDIGNDSTGCLSGVGGLLMWEQAKAAGAYISSNSYGSGFSGAYSAGDYEVDETTWQNEDFLIAFSAGNDGPGASSIGHPGHSKNALTVGALNHGNNTGVVSFSSRGPTSDGRRKPDIQAPGTSIISAGGNDEDAMANGGTGTSNLSGTSMSTPTTAGAAALMRQYFTDGYYPSGTKTAADARKPLGSELKATLMNGTAFIPLTPGNATGWGRVWLDNNLFFASETGSRDLRNFTVTKENGLVTGQTHTYQVQVGTGQEFRATLAWFDPPAALATGVSLVNNLNLEVQEGANIYRGNVISGTGATAVSITGGTADALNNVEQVRFTAPVAGTYTLRVSGSNVPGNGLRYSDRQGYALAVSTAQCNSAVTATPSAPTVSNSAGAVDVTSAVVAGASSYQVYRASGTCATAGASDFQLAGTAAGTTFVDSRTNGGLTYAYKVRGADTCGEGPISTCSEITSSAACTLFPEFDPQSVVLSNTPGATCGVSLNWSAATSECPSATSVVYNVYRSTDPFFVPGAANRIATGISAANFADNTVDSLQTYYYAVKAEDTTSGNAGPNGGNESPEIFRKKLTPSGSTSSPGTLIDGADSPSYMVLDDAWSVTNNRAAVGTLSYRNAADAPATYRADTCAAITTPPLPITNASVLTFKARYNVELDWDGVIMEISTDDGATWQDLPPSGGYPGDLSATQGNACGYPASQGAYNGSSGGVFVNQTRALTGFADSAAMIRWRFTSDGGAEEEGFYLDDVQITNSSVPDACVGIAIFNNGFE
jgi:hypothetical protein